MGAIKRRTAEAVDRFSLANNGCWMWDGPISTSGYGRLMVGSRNDGTRRIAYAHRFFYETFVGPIPSGFHLDHLCKCRLCVNPAHLEAVTPKVNVERSRKPSCPKGHSDFRIQTTKSGDRRRCNICYPIFGLPNSEKTHCPRGHPYDTIKKDGSRVCSICHASQSLESYYRNKHGP
jgi:hypothetical protein